MTYPSPDDAWQDPARSGQPSAPPVDPTRPTNDPPVPEQPTGYDPYAPAQPAAGQPGGDAYPMGGQPAPGHPPAGYYPTGYPPYPYPPVRGTNSMALAALILSLVGVGSCITAPVGAILGHVARRQIRETGEQGDGMAKAAIIVGWVLTGLLLLVIAFYVVVIVLAVSDSSSTY